MAGCSCGCAIGASVSPPAERERVLQRFVRGEAAPLRADGTGLGLAIVDRIVRAHGGTVQIDSSAAEGSTITLVLPQRAITPSQPPMEAT